MPPFLRVLLLICIIAGTAACAPLPRPPFSDEDLTARIALHDAREIQTHSQAVTRLIERCEHRMCDPDDDGTLHLLALSGGGDKGAFGAGFLMGWGSVTDPNRRRPDFDAVTGVSTGGMIAPFAFIGSDEAYRTVLDFYRNPRADWVHRRGWLFFLPANDSLLTIPGLRRDLKSVIDEAFAERMAHEADKGKILALSATDLDVARQRVWDVSCIAQEAAPADAAERIRSIMLASAAVPGVFPPIMIDDSLYVDGGVTANILLRLDPHGPHGLIARWREAYPDRPLPRIRYWIIVNGQLHVPPTTAEPSWIPIASRSLDLSISSATLSQIGWLVSEATMVNEALQGDVEVRVVAIPDSWRRTEPGVFKETTMRELAELGERMGADPSSWRLFGAPGTAERLTPGHVTWTASGGEPP